MAHENQAPESGDLNCTLLNKKGLFLGTGASKFLESFTKILGSKLKFLGGISASQEPPPHKTIYFIPISALRPGCQGVWDFLGLSRGICFDSGGFPMPPVVTTEFLTANNAGRYWTSSLRATYGLGSDNNTVSYAPFTASDLR